MSMIGPCHGAAGWPSTALAPSARALVDDDDLHLHAAPRAAARDSRWMRSASSRNSRPAVASARDELRRRADGRADHADAHAVDAEHRRRLHPVGASPVVLLDDVRREEREVGARLVLQDPLDAEVELVVAEARRVEPPRVLDVDRRHVLEQRRVRRRRADVVAGREQQRPARAARPPPRRTASRAGPRRRRDVAARRSSIGRRVELAVEVVQPDDRDRRVARGRRRAGRAARRPGCAPAPGCRAGTPPSARGRCCARRATVPRSIASPPARNVARMFVLLSRSCTSGT